MKMCLSKNRKEEGMKAGTVKVTNIKEEQMATKEKGRATAGQEAPRLTKGILKKKQKGK